LHGCNHAGNAEAAPGFQKILGVARFSADSDNRAAEFAITVRSD
jgi:hypothetical protein